MSKQTLHNVPEYIEKHDIHIKRQRKIKHRVPHRPTQVHKDKKRYTRKRKHTRAWSDY